MSEKFIKEQLNIEKEKSGLSFSKEDLKEILNSEKHNPEDLISLLEFDFKDIYESDAGVWEKYSIKEHTIMAMNQFEKYYDNKELPIGVDKNFFRFLLSLHDIGKPEALKNGSKHRQHEFTLKKAKTIFNQLDLSKNEWQLFEALVGHDYLGSYFKGEDINSTFFEVSEAYKKTDLSLNNFLDLLEIYYKVDAGSYTKDAGGEESLDRLFDFDLKNKNLNFSKEIEDKFNLLKDKVDNYEKQKEENILNIENNDLYRRILSEVEQVIIRPENYNEKKELLALNGQLSNLSEKEWKIVRTPSFKKWFGDWEKKYSKEDSENWVKYQYLKSLEEKSIPFFNAQIEGLEKDRTRFIAKNNEHYIKSYTELVATWRERKIEVLHEISKIQAEIVNKKFNPNLSDYGKLIDENGEPLVLWRATNYGPNDKGHFEVPLMGKEEHHEGVKVGTFLGKKAEAEVHHKGRLQEGNNSFLYSCFANVKDVDIISEKFYWGSEKEKIEKIQTKHDGIIVKQNGGELFKDGQINLMDLIVFNPKNILILDLE